MTFAIRAKTGYLAIFEETTAGTGPADWDADAFLVDHTSADVSGLVQTVAPDENIEGRIFASGDRTMLLGLKSGASMSSTHYMTGHGQTVAAAATATATHLAKLIKLAVCGQRISTSRNVTGGSATAPEVDSVTGLEEGDFLAFQDLTSPSAANSGICYVRRIVDISALVLTLDQALPFTPANGDIGRSCIAMYLDTAKLQDSTSASGTTASVKVELGEATPANEKVWELYGACPTLTIQDLNRDAPAQIKLDWMPGTWKTYDDVTRTTWSAAKSALTSVQPAMQGIGTTVFVQTYGTATSVCKPVNTIEVDLGVPRQRIETVTTCTTNLEGIAGYSVDARAMTKIKVGIGRIGDDWEGVLQGGGRQVVRYAVSRGPGYGWALHFSRCQLSATPTDKDIGSQAGYSVEWRAGEDLDNAGATTEDLWKSKAIIVLA